jgi:CHAD domain-containing protein
MTTTTCETERKYEIRPGQPLPRLDDLPEVAGSTAQEYLLEAEYYDTADFRLLRHGVTLRRRRGGPDPGWRLKLPASGLTRREVRLPLGRGGRQVPARLSALARGYTRGGALRPVARIQTRRQVLTLVDGAGDSLAEVADDDVSAESLGAETALSQWHEVEVELTGGGRRLLKAADSRLRRRGLQPSARAAKLERALAGQLPPRAQPPVPGGPDGTGPLAPGSAGAAVLGYLREQAARLLALDPLVRLEEPDAVHQMRVTARRLRSALQSFTEVIPAGHGEALIGELRWLGQVLGQARDAEVLAARLSRELHETPPEQVIGPVAARVRAHFAPVQAAAQRDITAALDSPRYAALLDALDRLLADPPRPSRAGRPAGDVLPAAARRAYRRTGRRLRRAERTVPGPARDTAYHQARKAAKRARYAGEAISPALGKPARRFARQMKRLQTVLGDRQDAVVARDLDRELGMSAHLTGENAFSYGLLHERETERATRLEREAQRRWERRDHPHFRQWAR